MYTHAYVHIYLRPSSESSSACTSLPVVIAACTVYSSSVRKRPLAVGGRHRFRTTACRIVRPSRHGEESPPGCSSEIINSGG